MRFSFLFVCLSILLSAHAALAGDLPFYMSGSAGAFVSQDYKRPVTFYNSSGMTGPGTAKTSYDAGPSFNLAAGVHLPLGFRVEGELGYSHYNISSVSPVSTNGAFPNLNGTRFNLASGGEQDLFTSTVNAFYDLPIPGPIVPYVGGGAGYYHLAGSEAHFAEPNGDSFTGHGIRIDNAMLLGEVGVSFKVSDNWSLVPAYRFDHFFVDSGESINAHVFKLGASYLF